MRKREKKKKTFRTLHRSTATINPAMLKQKAADYCIDEFNDRTSAFIVAQFFTWLISQSLFHAPFATEPSANNYNSSVIDICERDCSRSLMPLFLYIFLSSSFTLPLFLVLFFSPFALSPFLSPSLRPTDFTLLFLFFSGFRQWAESLCLAGRVVNLATLLPPLRSDLAHLIPLAEGRERRGWQHGIDAACDRSQVNFEIINYFM